MPVDGSDELKQTNEIGMVIPLLEPLDITGKTITADALLTQRKLAQYLVDHKAHYVFTVKDNQPTLREAIRLIFEDRGQSDFTSHPPWPMGASNHARSGPLPASTTTSSFLASARSSSSNVPPSRTTGKISTETVYGITSHTPASADATAVLAFNRGHWTIENGCHYILDWNWDEDRCTIRTGHGPENITALHRVAIGAIKSKSCDTVAATILRLARNVRLVFDDLRMTDNSRLRPLHLGTGVG